MIYGYARVSTATQGRDGNSLEEQTAALEKYGCQEIITEAFSGKTMERPKFQSLLERLQEGDTLVVCKLDRFARTAIEGVQTVRELFEKGINLVFLKERHIDTDEFKRRTQRHIERITTQDNKIDNLINGILELVEQFERENLKDNIRIAFERAEQERTLMIQRITTGKSVSQTKQGRPKGSLNKESEKTEDVKKIIFELSKDFKGQFSDAKIMREYLHIARNTYYKYKAELKDQEQ